MTHRFTFGAGTKNPRGFSIDVDDLATKFERDDPKVEAWWSPHVWTDDRRSSRAWQSSGAIAIDVDAHVDGKKITIDPFLDVVEQGFDFGVLPGSLYHATPHGFRLVFLLSQPCTSRDLYRAAAEGALNLVEKSIPELELGDEVDLDVDRPVTLDLARLLYHPKAIVDGEQRACRILCHEDEQTEEPVVFDAAALACVVPPPPPPQVPPPPPPPQPKPKADDLREAVAAWCEAHPRAVAELDAAAQSAKGECPACGHRDCFRPFVEDGVPVRGVAICYSTSHATDAPGVGQPTSKGTRVDALDLYAYRAARSPVAILLEEGYLEGDEPPPLPEDGRAVVMLPRDEPHYVSLLDYAEATLEALPRDLLFRAGGRVGAMRVEGDDARHADVSGAEALLLAQRHVEFRTHRYNAGTKSYVVTIANPTPRHGNALVEHAKSSPLVSDLRGVYTTPTFAGDYDLLRPGYNATTRLFYREPHALRGLRPDVGFRRDEAREFFATLFEDFADVCAPSAIANAVGLAVTLVVRPCLPYAPLHAAISTTEGSGKTTLVDRFVGTLVQGRTPPRLRTLEEQELAKTLFSHARGGSTFLTIDNARDGSTLDSPMIAELVTSDQYDARVLGVSQVERARNLFTVAITANNLSLSPELTRRTVPIVFAPDRVLAERTFRHVDVRSWIEANRRRALELILGAVEAWKTAGRPSHPNGNSLPGFPEWSNVVGGVLGLLGVEGWLEGREEFAASANSWDDAARDFLREWYQSPSIMKTTTVSNLVQIVEDDPTALGIHAGSDRGVLTALAIQVRKMAGRPSLLPYRVVRCGRKWRVSKD